AHESTPSAGRAADSTGHTTARATARSAGYTTPGSTSGAACSTGDTTTDPGGSTACTAGDTTPDAGGCAAGSTSCAAARAADPRNAANCAAASATGCAIAYSFTAADRGGEESELTDGDTFGSTTGQRCAITWKVANTPTNYEEFGADRAAGRSSADCPYADHPRIDKRATGRDSAHHKRSNCEPNGNSSHGATSNTSGRLTDHDWPNDGSDGIGFPGADTGVGRAGCGCASSNTYATSDAYSGAGHSYRGADALGEFREPDPG
ncbi:MAG: hypothetical protein M3380_16210, partial [Chloroflexota bacterium]|nr:hypothetical protein [Chloroflexota bacterium]